MEDTEKKKKREEKENKELIDGTTEKIYHPSTDEKYDWLY